MVELTHVVCVGKQQVSHLLKRDLPTYRLTLCLLHGACQVISRQPTKHAPSGYSLSPRITDDVNHYGTQCRGQWTV